MKKAPWLARGFIPKSLITKNYRVMRAMFGRRAEHILRHIVTKEIAPSCTLEW